jgi:type II secretory pathway pseudopilin PulG
VALIVIVAVMSVLVAAALPYWSQVMRREREAELIFRGLQYAEAIRVFQLRFNRLPNTLDELVEVSPRSIRRLWKDPMTDNGRWTPIFAQAGQAGRGRQIVGGTGPGGQESDSEEDGTRPGRGRRTGPIIGVRSRSRDESVREFMGRSVYAEWQFTVELIPVPVTVPGTLLVPRPTSEWVGKPFRQGLEPKQGAAPGQTPGGKQQRRKR